MNSSVNHSQNTNKSTTSHEAAPSEETINKSDIKQSLSIPTNGLSSESNVKSINNSSDTDMAKEHHQGTKNSNTLAVTDTQPLNPPKSNHQDLSETDTPNSMTVRQHPIAPPSEPKQYRAIGLVRGRYEPSTEQFTRGFLQTPDGSEIDAVLLGRVMSLLKNHLDLESEHLWVVYPRTRQENNDLHIQIMGVWEPETLRKIRKPSTELTNEEQDLASSSLNISATAEEDESQEKIQETEDIDNSQETTIIPIPETETDSFATLDDGYFSIRGEVIYQSQDEEYVIVKVQQSARKGEEEPRFFKLKLKGHLGDRPLNRFWDLHIQRDNTSLVIQYGNDIGSLLLNNRRQSPSRGRKTFNNNNKSSYSRVFRPKSDNSATNSTPIRKEPLPKPTKRNKNPDEQES
ncbi:MAG: hypothetical protein F6K40_15795 [Okeania sp. SIO3I5]|uniref:hypothetical protein n=1 Tax=Okeania sp. SIO3I5 TaxID=2607805 RepID=UPI0013BE37B4|nr:hypothetical protein [Okeania sp. SIO3I5]NEQ37646.1 hypothetical protein [Okeania sp. SIO3I5]